MGESRFAVIRGCMCRASAQAFERQPIGTHQKAVMAAMKKAAMKKASKAKAHAAEAAAPAKKTMKKAMKAKK